MANDLLSIVKIDSYMYEAYVDLDELIIRCRDKLSREFIQEAVSCYRTGAFRSCIVATWNAVVFDFLHKLRELELSGDKKAKNFLKDFESLRNSRNYKKLWQFESEISQNALEEFELLSDVEKLDIDRLFEDRSRCAHPSMTSLEEPFEATAELARYHLRSAVTHLLARPPVQGQAAQDEIFQSIKSVYFPKDLEKARETLKHGPLARARHPLIRNIIRGLTISLLNDERSDDERARQFAALNAISKIHPQPTKEILNSDLSKIILDKVEDEKLDRAIIYLGTFLEWDLLSEPCKIKLEAYIKTIDISVIPTRFLRSTRFPRAQKSENSNIFLLEKASYMDFLRPTVDDHLRGLSLRQLIKVLEYSTDNLFKEKSLYPILIEMSPEASLFELLLVRSNSYLEENQEIKNQIKERIKISPANELIKIISRNPDTWLLNEIELDLKTKIPDTKLKDLLDLKYRYKSIEQPIPSILEIFNASITRKTEERIDEFSLEEISELMAEQDEVFTALINDNLKEFIPYANLEQLLDIKESFKLVGIPNIETLKLIDKHITKLVRSTPFKDLLNLKSYWNEIPNELFISILKAKISEIVDIFSSSNSFRDAAENSRLLLDTSEFLSPKDWRNTLNAFLDNDQIYGAARCWRVFESLFKKSFELSGTVEPHWIFFRDRINSFSQNDRDVRRMKQLIDSYLE